MLVFAALVIAAAVVLIGVVVQKLATWDWVAPADLTAAALAGTMQVVLVVKQAAQVKRIAWHRKGDYISTVAPTASTAHVIIHQVACRTRAQSPSHSRRVNQLSVFITLCVCSVV